MKSETDDALTVAHYVHVNGNRRNRHFRKADNSIADCRGNRHNDVADLGNFHSGGLSGTWLRHQYPMTLHQKHSYSAPDDQDHNGYQEANFPPGRLADI